MPPTAFSVCLFGHSGRLEGADRSLLEAAEVLRAKGVRVHVVVPRFGALVDALRACQIDHTVHPYSWWLGRSGEHPLIRMGRFAAMVASALLALTLPLRLHRYRFDVIVSNTVAAPWGAMVAGLLNVPHMWYIREYVESDHNMEYLLGKSRSLSLVAGSAHQVLYNSEALRNAYGRYLGHRPTMTIYQAVRMRPIDSASPRQSHQGRLSCVLVGRLHQGKGQATAIDAVAECRHQGLDVELVLVGRGKPEYERTLRQRTEGAGVSDLVKFVGHSATPDEHVQECDVALMCSRNEAFGRVTVEAFKLGRPVIGARSGGTTELIRDGENGWLFTAGDAGDLASRLFVAFANRDRLDAMGQSAKAEAEATFNDELYAASLLKACGLATASGKHSRRFWAADDG